MILTILRLLKSLSGYHYRTVILTILLPAVGPASLAFFAPDCFVLRVVLYLAAFLVWSLLAVLAVASMLRRDRSEAEQQVDQKFQALSSRVNDLGEKQENIAAGLRQQVKDLEETVRKTLKEELEVVLPPRPVSIGVSIPSGISTTSVAVTVSGGSKLVRFKRWVRRALRRFWELAYGKPEDG